MATKARAEHPPVKTYTAYLVTDGEFSQMFVKFSERHPAQERAFAFAAQANYDRERSADIALSWFGKPDDAEYSVCEYTAYWNGIPAA